RPGRRGDPEAPRLYSCLPRPLVSADFLSPSNLVITVAPVLAVIGRSRNRIEAIPSWRSRGSIASAFSAYSVLSFGSMLSVLSLLSVGSAGSILSIGSTGSILSIGSAGSILSIGGAGTFLSVGGRRRGAAGPTRLRRDR